jgi:hypothetical protein
MSITVIALARPIKRDTSNNTNDLQIPGRRAAIPMTGAPAFFKRNLDIGKEVEEVEKLAELLSDL